MGSISEQTRSRLAHAASVPRGPLTPPTPTRNRSDATHHHTRPPKDTTIPVLVAWFGRGLAKSAIYV
jgi:hypothetical protein